MAETLLSTGNRYEFLPERYKRPLSERPNLSLVVKEEIPLIDLECPDRAKIVRQIGEACRLYGFFQVINHGISGPSMEEIMGIGREFFHLPMEEKMKLYSDDPAKKTRLSTSFNVKKETVHNWRDYLRLHCYPLEEFVHDWPASPSAFKQIVSKYCTQVREVGFHILEYISESLGLERKYMEKVMGEQAQHMAMNFYPPCPEPDLTYGLPAHTDPNTLTILLQDQEVAGLQVYCAGRWMAVDPHPGSFVINIGDQIQALSNGEYKSVWHRAIVNSDKERISVASFLCPGNGAVIGPAKQLASDESPAIYRDFTYDEYYKKFWSRNLDDEHCLELFKR
ncbi:flavanone 3-dioxygenase 2-like [Aristolochia californica]|uniref:flavanone 3-dioxygenase 2-like n=1 Tax=Aristolochia californica TaxID=171875 RepID=UPI0035D6810B